MRAWRLLGAIIFLSLALVVSLPAATGDTNADLVLGHTDFIHGSRDNLNGTGLDAPGGVAVDSHGRLYVADTFNNRVLGFRNAASFANGAAADLVFGQPDLMSNGCNLGFSNSSIPNALCWPLGLAVDANDNVYIADSLNNRVLGFAAPFDACASGPCTAGNAVFEIGEGSGNPENCNQYDFPNITAGTLCYPTGVATDGAGNLYVADEGAARVLEFNTPMNSKSGEPGAGDSVADLVFGQSNFTAYGCSDSPPPDSIFRPAGVAVDANQNLYVADYDAELVYKYDTPLNASSGEPGAGDTTPDVTFGCGTGVAGPCTPFNIAIDSSNNLYLADATNSRVLEFNAGSTSSTETFTGFNFTTAGDAFGGVATDSIGNLYVADSFDNRALRFDTPLNASSGEPGAGDTTPDAVLGQTDFTHVAIDNLNATALNSPSGVVIDSHGHLYVADSGNGRVLGYSSVASLTNGAAADLLIGQTDFQTANCTGCSPGGLAVDGSDNLYVAYPGENQVSEFDAPYKQGKTSGFTPNLQFGDPGSPDECSDTPGDSLCTPVSVAIDSQGDVYIADTMDARVLEYSPPFASPPAPTAVFGTCNNFNGFSCPSFPSADTLSFPTAVTVDSAGNLYVADAIDDRVLEYNTPLNSHSGEPGAGDTTADAVFGQNNNFTTMGCNLGTGWGGTTNASTLCQPNGLGIDATGNLYVIDGTNNRVLRYNTPLNSGSGEPGAGDTVADVVFGHDGSFEFFGCDGGQLAGDLFGVGPDSLCYSPNNGFFSSYASAFVDLSANLWLTDSLNNRVLVFDQPPNSEPSPTASATATASVTPTATATSTPTSTARATATPTATPTPGAGSLTVPKELKFGKSTKLGATSKSKKATVKNSGKKGAAIVTIGTATTDNPVFKVSAQCSTPMLAPGKSCKILVTFSPTDTTPATGHLIVNDDARGAPQMVPLSGTGKAQKVKK